MLISDYNITVSPGVYPPSEDTQLLLDCIEICEKEWVLDMGTGTGILAIAAAMKGGIVTAADISKDALECAGENAARNGVKLTTIRSDLFDCIQQSYDVIIFNPPYLPSEHWSKKSMKDRQWDGGGDGSDTVKAFLQHLPDHLSGRCYLLFSSITGSGEVTIQHFIKSKFTFKKLGERKLFFETLYVYELKAMSFDQSHF